MESSQSPETRVKVAVWQICPPVLFAFGTFGNTMTVVILRRMKMKRSAMPVYLTALAISDTSLLLTGLLRYWLVFTFELDVRSLHPVVCKTHTWVVYSSIVVSAWLLSCMTIERTLSVWRPHHVSLLCTRTKAVVIIVAIIVMALSVNSHMLWWLDVVEHNGTSSKACTVRDSEYRRFFNTEWTWLDLTLSSLLPFVLVLTGNVLIIWKVSVSMKIAKKLVNSRPQDISHRRKKTSSMTVTLMVLSAVFFLTTSPICVYNIIEPYVLKNNQGDLRARERLQLAWAVVNILMYTNNTINFYLYCLSGARFRRELKQCLCCRLLPPLSPSKNAEAASVTNASHPPADAPSNPVALTESFRPDNIQLVSQKGPARPGKGCAKRETNNQCELLSMRPCDQNSVFCSDL